MTRVSRYRSARAKLAAGWRDRALSLKAVAFGLVGVVNTVVDYGVFLFARAEFDQSPAASATFLGCPAPAAAAMPGHFLDRRKHAVVARRRHRLLHHEFVDHLRREFRT